MTFVIFLVSAVVLIYVIMYRKQSGTNVYKFFMDQVSTAYDKFAPYSFKVVRDKVKDLGQEYSAKEYAIQVGIFAGAAAVVSYLYFYNILISIIYIIAAIAIIPYLTYLRCKRLYSEFIFEQIQVYTSNTIMEFATTQSFVKSLEGVVESGVLEEPIKSDVQTMIDLAYANGTIEESLNFMAEKYNFYMVKNMHQLFLQINNEGSKDAGEALENMSQDIDMLVESVYRDRIDRASFHKKFLQFGIVLYLMVSLVQFLLGVESYIEMLDKIWVQLILHGIVIMNSYFLLSGEKYYNEDVGGE